MTLGKLLHANKDAILQRWVEDALAVYSPDAAVAFGRQQDRFANPIGQSLREGTEGIFAALLDGMDAKTIDQHLREIIKIRAVQQFPASEAVGFVLRLKQAIRTEIGAAAEDPRFASDLTTIHGTIDLMALAAFDVYVECREQLCKLRVNEIKRSVSWIVGKLNGRDQNQCGASLESIESSQCGDAACTDRRQVGRK